MPLFLFVAGVLLVMTAYQDTTDKFLGQLRDDLVGEGGFLIWAGVISAIFVGGNVIGLGKPARVLIIIMIAAFVFRNPDVLGKLQSALSSPASGEVPSPISTGEAATVSGPEAQIQTASGSGGSSGAGGGGAVESAAGAITGGGGEGTVVSGPGGLGGAIGSALGTVKSFFGF